MNKDWTALNRREFLAALGATYGSAALAWAAPRSWFVEYARPGQQPPVERFINTLCPMCPGGCGLTVRVVHDCAVGVRGNVDHPINRGGLCSRAAAVLQDMYNPDRLTRPLKRAGERGEDRWEETSWDSALQSISAALMGIRNQGTPERCCVLLGRDRGLVRAAWSRFMRAYGSPNLIDVFPDDNLQALPAVLATHGSWDRIGYDVAEAAFVLSFSSQWLDAHWSTEQAARGFADFRRGRPGLRPSWVHVEPRYSLTAAKADEWLPIHPGTEGALALSIAHVLIREGLYDRRFVEQHGYGFEDWTDAAGHSQLGFRRMVLRDYSPAEVQERTGVPEGDIFRIARLFGANAPALALGFDGGGCSAQSTYDRMAIHCLNALSGSIDVPGGVTVFQEWTLLAEDVPLDTIAERGLGMPRLDGPVARRRLSDNAVDLLADSVTAGNPYPTEAVLLLDADPVFNLAEGNKLAQAMAKVPFVAAFSGYLNDSTRYADVVLPTVHGLHRWDFDVAHTLTGHPVVTLAQPVVPALDHMPDPYGMLHSLSRLCGEPLASVLPWSSSEEAVEAACRELFETSRGAAFGPANEENWAQLLESRGWRAPFSDNFKKFKASMLSGGGWTDPIYFHREWDRIFRSPSKKFAFHSRYLKRSFEAMPDPDDPVPLDRRCLPKCRTERPKRDPGYPLQLYVYTLPNLVSVSSPNLPWLNDVAGTYMLESWRTWVEIHPETAAHLGVAEGEHVVVQTRRGALTLPVRIYAGLQSDVIAVPFGFGHRSGGRWTRHIGDNPAVLVDPRIDPLTGRTLWNSTPAAVQKVNA